VSRPEEWRSVVGIVSADQRRVGSLGNRVHREARGPILPLQRIGRFDHREAVSRTLHRIGSRSFARPDRPGPAPRCRLVASRVCESQCVRAQRPGDCFVLAGCGRKMTLLNDSPTSDDPVVFRPNWKAGSPSRWTSATSSAFDRRRIPFLLVAGFPTKAGRAGGSDVCRVCRRNCLR
jgi:hypothetical protein